MNILFLTLAEINTIQERGIYHDLLRKFVSEGHLVSIVTPVERRKKTNTNLLVTDGANTLQVKTLNIQKANIVEKGIGTLAIEYQYLNAIKKHLNHIKFDLILYSTPPITFYKVIHFIKKRDNAFAYLLLKDIFPQNAVDMKMMKSGSVLHKMFVKKEKKLYKISDAIGCMSQANVNFILKNNPEINTSKVDVNPNTIEPILIEYSQEEKNAIRQKYNLPLDKKIFVYGGNLGKPQGLDFLLETIENSTNEKAFFLIVGSGTEYSKIKKWFRTTNPKNALLIASLPKKDYDVLLNACDVGLIFLHKDFTIPNFPSRLLSYLEIKMPVIAATDANSDIGDVLEQSNCGFKILTGDLQNMQDVVNKLCDDSELIENFGQNGFELLKEKYDVGVSYQLIQNKIYV